MLQERELERVGSSHPITVDVRVLAATNRDLEREAQRGTFRNDLYFRLAVILLALPPLRERGDDVLLLAEHFLDRFRVRYGKEVRTIDAQAQALLLQYEWPGNVRELSHVIERAVLWSRGPVLGAELLSGMSRAPDAPPGAGASDEGRGAPPPFAAPGAPQGRVGLMEWERAMIEQALREAGGNQTRAAQRLGISRDTLRYRLKKFGLEA